MNCVIEPDIRTSRAHQTHRPSSQPRYGLRRLGQAGLFQQRVVGSFAQANDDLFRRDLDVTRRVDELPKQLGRASPAESLQSFRQLAVQKVREHRQGQVKVHVQANVTAQAIEVKERDLLTKVVLHVIPAGVGLDDFASRLRLRPVVGQEKGRRFVPQPRHDQLPHGAFVAVELDPFIDILDLAALPLGLSDLAVLPAIRGQSLHALPTCPIRVGGW